MGTPDPKRQRYRLLSIPVSVFAVILVYWLQTPNPMMILIIPVVFFAYADGYIGGALSGLVALAYSLSFFSDPDHLFVYTDQNAQKTLTIVAAVCAIVALVGKLKERDARSLREKEEHAREMVRINQELDAAVLKAQNANKAKSQFISRVSHDIRTPMNAILGMTRLATDKADDPLIVNDCLAKVDSAAKFLLGLINDVLDMSKIESGELTLTPERYSFQDFNRDILAMFAPLCAQKGLRFTFHPDEQLPAVMVDKIRFKQIFMNLLSNAVKFTPEGGTVTFSIEGGPAEHGVIPCTFVVSDSGTGMSPAFQEKMFEPFTQELAYPQVQAKGTGLGLPIVKSIVDLLGGTISVVSAEGAGTRFTIRLDLRIAPEAAESTDQTGAVPLVSAENCLAGRHILLAEDEPINTEIAEYLLSSQGAVVTCAENGEKALEAFANAPEGYFDAVLMDIRMPVMDGLEAAARLRALNRKDARQVPIIAMTANAFGDDVTRSLESGMNKHLTKPIDAALLYGTLTALMRSAPQAPQTAISAS